MNAQKLLEVFLNHASLIHRIEFLLVDGLSRMDIGIILLKMGMQLGMLGKVAITLSQMARWQPASGFMMLAINLGTI